MSNRLTYKQKTFVDEFIKTKNATISALKAYNVKSRKVAQTIGSENLSKPMVKRTIETLLQASGYDPRSSIHALIENQEKGKGVKATASDSIRASELLLKMSGHLQDKKQSLNVNYNYENFTEERAHQFIEKYSNTMHKRREK